MGDEVIKIILIGVGILVPVSVSLFNRYMKGNDEKIDNFKKECGEKFDTIFRKIDELKICDEGLKTSVTEIQTDLKWIKNNKENGE